MSGPQFTTVQCFSATLQRDRDALGEQVTRYLADHPDLEVVDKAVTQSSDAEFHCLTITLFLAPRERPRDGLRASAPGVP
jgi:hypothetical protein